MNERPPNIIYIITDQERYDTIGALGFPWLKTPNLDRLVNEGVAFSNCHCTAPSCVPARASLFNLQYPHDLNVCANGDPWDTSWVESLRESGYRTINIGKMHTQPFDVECGFDRRFVVENKDRPTGPDGFYDEWDKFLLSCGQRKPSRVHYKAEREDYGTALGAFAWELEEKYHPDVFVGNMATQYIRRHRDTKPLFLQIGFPGPHPPYDPPERYLRMYDDVEIPVPEFTDEEIAGQPPPQAGYRAEMIKGDHDSIQWNERPTKEQLQRMWKHYAANMTLIDDQVGQILDALKEGGWLDDAVVVFTSDHGDAMGDHGHIEKWTMYDCVTRVPMVMWSPGRIPAGKKLDGLIQPMDVSETLLEYAGVSIPEEARSVSVQPMFSGESKGRDVVFSEHCVTLHLKEMDFMTMVRTRDCKAVHYVNEDFGELYDLEADPGELKNLWDDPAYEQKKREMLDILLNWRISLPTRRAERIRRDAYRWSYAH